MYGLWRHGEHLFVDGTLGWGRLGFDIKRWSDPAGAAATAERDGNQSFGALTVGYERTGDRTSLTGYGRFDASRTRLDAYREFGLGIYDLAYGSQTVKNNGLAVGLEGSYLVQGANGVFRPYWMLEYRDAISNSSDVDLNYVVMPVANDYTLGLRGYGNNALMYGGGVDMDIAAGWKLSLLLRREHASGMDASTSFGLLLSFNPRAQPMSASAPDLGEAAQATAKTGD